MDSFNDFRSYIKSEPSDADYLANNEDGNESNSSLALLNPPNTVSEDFPDYVKTEVKLEHIVPEEVHIDSKFDISEFQCMSNVEKDSETEDTEERETLMFIDIIKKRPAIWDVHCKDYLDETKKQCCWNDVLALMVPDSEKLTEEKKLEKISEMQNKWRHLKNQFMREYIKELEFTLKKSLVQKVGWERQESSSGTGAKRKRQEVPNETETDSSDEDEWDEDMFSVIFLHQFMKALPEDERLVVRTKMLKILVESFSKNTPKG